MQPQRTDAQDAAPELESERAILATLIAYPDALERLDDILPEDFARAAHATILRAIRRLAIAGHPLSQISVLTEIRRAGDPIEYADFAALADYAAAPTSLPWHIAQIAAAASQRKIREIAHKLLADDPIDPLEAAQRLEAAATRSSGDGWGRFASDLDSFLGKQYERPPSIIGGGLLTRGGLSIIYGEGGLGKSYLVLQLLVSAARGESWLGLEAPERPIRSGYVGMELTGYELQLRLRRILGADYQGGLGDMIQPISLSDLSARPNLLEPQTVSDCIQWIRRSRLDLVVMDAMSRFHDGDEVKDGPRIMAAADRIRMQSGACVMFVHHPRSVPAGQTDTSNDSMRGHTKFRDDPTTILKLSRHVSGLLKLECTKANHADEPDPIFLAKADSGHGFVTAQSPETKSDRHRDRVLQALMENPTGISTASIQAATGFARNTTWRHLKALAKQGLVENVGAENAAVWRPCVPDVPIGGGTRPNDYGNNGVMDEF